MRTPIHFSESDDLVDIRLDIVFKAVFARDTPASRGALSRLVSSLIGRNVVVTEANANEPAVDSINERQIRFDINCRAENGELIEVEMSLNPDSSELARLEYYVGKLFTSQGIRGTDQSFGNLKRAYQINILAKGRFFPDDAALHTFEYYDIKGKMPFNGKTRIITLELPKLDRALDKPIKELTGHEQWGIFLQYLTDKKKRVKINEIIEEEEGIAMASKVLNGFTEEEKEAIRIRRQEKYELDRHSDEVEARRKAERRGERKGRAKGLAKGLAEGRTEGLTKGRAEILNLLKSGKPVEEILRDFEGK